MKELLNDEKTRVLITGTRGRVGNAIVPTLAKVFDVFEFDKSFSDSDNERQIPGDITEFDVIAAAVKKTRPECIIHLAGNANQDAPAEEIEQPNYTGLRNVYEAAAKHKVPKIVFASSLHTLSGHPGFAHRSPFEDGRKFRPQDPPKPGNPYGESKVWGEQLAKEYFDKHGIRTIALRIGDVNNENAPSTYQEFTTVWLSHADASQLFQKAVLTDAPEPVAVYFATSNNDGPYDIQPTINDLHYQPVDGVSKE